MSSALSSIILNNLTLPCLPNTVQQSQAKVPGAQRQSYVRYEIIYNKLPVDRNICQWLEGYQSSQLYMVIHQTACLFYYR